MVEIPLSYAIVTGVGEYVVNEIANDAIGGRPERISLIVPGEIAWDKCDCGLFAQTITSIAPTSSFPTSGADVPVRGCGHQMEMVSVTMTLLRCISGPVNGVAPNVKSLAHDALVVESDRTVMRHALTCYLKKLRDIPPRIFDFTVGAATSVGPDGGCGGVTINYSFAIANSAMCC